MYRAVFEFRLTRRVDWSGDLAAFYEHVELVRSRINASERTDDVRVITNMAESRLTLDFLMEATDENAAEAVAMYTVSRAIRRSGARYVGLAAFADDSTLARSPLSELRTPIWQRQRLRIAKAA